MSALVCDDNFTQLRPQSGGRISILLGSGTVSITVGDLDSPAVHATASLADRELDDLITTLQAMRERSLLHHA